MITAEEILEHHGVKGMHWGVHRSEKTPTVTVTDRAGNKKVKAEGGDGHPAHEDAKKAAAQKQIAKKNSTDALSTADLKKLVERLNLEQQYSRLSNPNKGEIQKFVEEQLKSVGRQKLQSALAAQAKK